MKKQLIACIVALIGFMALTACGQKGPLYLPGNPSEVQSEVPRQEPPKEEEDEESNSNQPD